MGIKASVEGEKTIILVEGQALKVVNEFLETKKLARKYSNTSLGNDFTELSKEKFTRFLKNYIPEIFAVVGKSSDDTIDCVFLRDGIDLYSQEYSVMESFLSDLEPFSFKLFTKSPEKVEISFNGFEITRVLIDLLNIYYKFQRSEKDSETPKFFIKETWDKDKALLIPTPITGIEIIVEDLKEIKKIIGAKKLERLGDIYEMIVDDEGLSAEDKNNLKKKYKLAFLDSLAKIQFGPRKEKKVKKIPVSKVKETKKKIPKKQNKKRK